MRFPLFNIFHTRPAAQDTVTVTAPIPQEEVQTTPASTEQAVSPTVETVEQTAAPTAAPQSYSASTLSSYSQGTNQSALAPAKSTYPDWGFPLRELHDPALAPADSTAADSIVPIPMKDAGALPEAYQSHEITFQGLDDYTPDEHAATLPVVSIGKSAEAVSYRPFADSSITLSILLAFFVLSYVLTNGKRYLAQQIKNLFSVRERASFFAVETGADVRYRTLLVLLSNFLLSLFFFDYTYDRQPELFREVPPMLLLSLYATAILLFFVLRLGLYHGINLIFFDKSQRHQWVESYLLINSLMGIVLFPLLLLVVFFNLPQPYSYISFAILFGIGEIMLIYKCFCIFFSKRHGAFHLILYLCTLEMVPGMLLWKILTTAQYMLIK